MGKIAVLIKASLENVESIVVDPNSFIWYLQFQCTDCQDKTDTWHTLSLSEPIPQKIGTGSVHYASKCKFCKKDNSVCILTSSPGVYNKDDSDKFKQIGVFDCRRLDIVGFDFRDGYKVIAENSNKIFDNCNFSDKDWADYDEREQQTVGVYELEYKIEGVK